MIKNVTFLTVIITITSSMAASKSVNLDTAIACNPEILPFLPERYLNKHRGHAGSVSTNDIYMYSQ